MPHGLHMGSFTTPLHHEECTSQTAEHLTSFDFIKNEQVCAWQGVARLLRRSDHRYSTCTEYGEHIQHPWIPYHLVMFFALSTSLRSGLSSVLSTPSPPASHLVLEPFLLVVIFGPLPPSHSLVEFFKLPLSRGAEYQQKYMICATSFEKLTTLTL